ncbi:hypothetical protein [Oceanobacillus halophilus]|uniref:Uncharacterized protein n=1 Tax=Oceanobacillus halophilus TaxID=930130 RepID=A0A494ZW32_9BACI|nr:hypothetical protein [Oceanobacillus halophilus]RKQ30497.1 hypothetical protein D8M06_15475 [Oceanobacillus halophilus]
MEYLFYVTVIIIVGFSLLYYGYDKKKSYELKLKEIELEKRKLDLELINIENGINQPKENE